MIAGIDGCKHGWLVASLRSDGSFLTERCDLDRISDLCGSKMQNALIDVPIGLLDSGTRLADSGLRQLLKKRACCVFTAPIRPVLDCSTYSEAAAKRRELEGKSMSQQAWCFTDKFIKPVDRILSRNPKLQSGLREGHPEFSFYLMKGAPISFGKKTIDGHAERLKLLAPFLGDRLGRELRKYPKYLHNDVVDACALLWSADRLREQHARTIPNGAVQKDRFGLVMEIVG